MHTSDRARDEKSLAGAAGSVSSLGGIGSLRPVSGLDAAAPVDEVGIISVFLCFCISILIKLSATTVAIAQKFGVF